MGLRDEPGERSSEVLEHPFSDELRYWMVIWGEGFSALHIYPPCGMWGRKGAVYYYYKSTTSHSGRSDCWSRPSIQLALLLFRLAKFSSFSFEIFRSPRTSYLHWYILAVLHVHS